MNELHSIILTVHNKDFLLKDSLARLRKFTKGNYELVLVLDGCTDKSEAIALKFAQRNSRIPMEIHFAPDVFETKANNIALRNARGDYAIILQDDMLINEVGWNLRMTKPFRTFDDVFAVSANCAHNWRFNPQSVHLGMAEDLDTGWCDIIEHIECAGKPWGLPRDEFAVRQTVNRGPLALHLADVRKLGYFDEIYAPLSMDDHDLCLRMSKEIGKVVGCYWIDFHHYHAWGGTHEGSGQKPWVYKAHHRNSKILWQRHSELVQTGRRLESRKLV